MNQRTTPYRPPPPACSVAWPAGWGRRFTVFVDTEEEFDWSAPLSRTSVSVTASAAIPAAAARLRDMGAPLTFLVDHAIATAPQSIEAISRAIEDSRSAVGTQLHPWVNPPFEEIVDTANSFAGCLSPALEAAKLDHLDAAIRAAFGIKSKVFRAGRYGLGPNTLTLLAERGYRIDTSMRARYDYANIGGPDFSDIGNSAFRTSEGLVELPLTTIFLGAARRLGTRIDRAVAAVPHGRGVLARLGLLERIGLTPEDMPLTRVLEAIRVGAGEALPVLNFAFHSPSLVPGNTPYVRDAADLAAFWRWWDGVLGLLARLNIRSASLDDLLAAT